MNEFHVRHSRRHRLVRRDFRTGRPGRGRPVGHRQHQDIINSLEASGYRVVLNKLGDAPLDQTTVVAVRPGREVTHRVTESGGDSIEQVLYTTVYVDVK